MNNWVPAPYRSTTINFSRMHQSPTWEANEFIVLTYGACKGLCTKAWLSEILTAMFTSLTAEQTETPPPSFCSPSTAALASPSTLCNWGRTCSGWEAQEGVNRTSGSVQWPAHLPLRRSASSHQVSGSLTRSCSCSDENNGCYAQIALKKWHKHVCLPSYKKYKNTQNTPNFIWMYLLI